MNGPFSNEYCQAVCTELETIECMGAWDVVDREDEMSVIRLTWGFNL